MTASRETLAWVRLARTENIGPVTFRNLVSRFGSASAALEELPRLARRGGGKSFTAASLDEAEAELTGLAKIGGRIITGRDNDFPAGLAALDPPPQLISVLGRLPQKEMIAIVGARNASALARKFAADLARDLGEAGLVVVSGMARGIDSAAHEAALPFGTIAVLAGGVDVVYPPENENLYRQICERGAVISEMRLGEAPQARHFPRRNRLISGLARGVVVVEAAERSGSLITANYAAEQGREVFAVPGSPLDPRARGANKLIRDGATLIQGASDVLEVLGSRRELAEPERAMEPAPISAAALEAQADRIRGAVEQALGPAPVGIDELIRNWVRQLPPCLRFFWRWNWRDVAAVIRGMGCLGCSDQGCDVVLNLVLNRH